MGVYSVAEPKMSHVKGVLYFNEDVLIKLMASSLFVSTGFLPQKFVTRN